jgi:hypothetical protein
MRSKEKLKEISKKMKTENMKRRKSKMSTSLKVRYKDGLTEEHKRKIGESRRGVKVSEEGRKNISEGLKNRYKDGLSEEHKRKIRYSISDMVDRRYGQPIYNKRILGFFEWYDTIVLQSGNGIYAEHPMEEKCGPYWIDYINHEKKIIIEWDEKHHNTQKNKDRDEVRDNYIREKYGEYSFYRLSELDHPYLYEF